MSKLLCICVTILACGSALAEDKFRVAAKKPKEALKTFKLAKGYRIELVAAEPLIRDPVAISFDARGRMFVVEYPEFNNYSFKPGFKVTSGVKLLRDTDKDGVYDLATKFADGLPMATAVACFDGGVFVGAAPNVYFCKDTNGDGKADVKRIVLTGFGRDFAGGGLLNSFHWGMDNRFHIATGFAGGNVRQRARPNARPISIRASGLILDPRTGFAEATSGGGQHGLGMDDWGTKYLCSNVNPMQQLAYDSRYMARNPYFAPPVPSLNVRAEGPRTKLFRISPREPWRVIRAQRTDSADEGHYTGLFTSASGISIYRGDAWPINAKGTLIVGEVANNLVYRAKVEPNGVPNLARRFDAKREFIASTDIWFRPVQFANGPDGNLYVVDMYRELIEGAAFVPRDVLRKLDPTSGTDRGRIYRVVAEGKQRRPFKRLDNLSTYQLVGLLKHTNGWHRDTAARLLYERQDTKAVPVLRQQLVGKHSPLTKAQALHALQGMKRLTVDDLAPVLAKEQDHRLLQAALRLAEPFLSESPQLVAHVMKHADHRNVRVRWQVAFTLGRTAAPQRLSALVKILKRDAANRWVRSAVQSGLIDDAGRVLYSLSQDKTFRSEKAGQIVLQSLAEQIGVQDRSGDLLLFIRSFRAIPASEAAVRASLMQGVRRYSRRIRGLLSQQGVVSNDALAKIVQRAKETALDVSAELKERAEAVRSLYYLPFNDSTKNLFQRLLTEVKSETLQHATLRALANVKADGVADLILRHGWPRYSGQMRQRAIDVLSSRDNWTLQLLNAAAKKEFSAQEISIERLSLLALHSNAKISATAKRLLKTQRRASRSSVIAKYQKQSLKLTGNPDRGKSVFKQNCSACHRRQDKRIVGGNLLDLADKPAESILIHVLDPNRVVKPKYLSYLVEDKDGRVLAGMITAETETSVTVQRTDGTARTLLRVAIQSIKSNGRSFMPEGLEKKINFQAMADLIAYLRS